MSFGMRLKKQRETMNLSQQELASRLNLSQSTIAYYELDKKQPPHATLNKIASFFDVSIDYLLGRTNDSVSTSSNAITTVDIEPGVYIAYLGGPPEVMDEVEAEHLKRELEMFRAFREKRKKDRKETDK